MRTMQRLMLFSAAIAAGCGPMGVTPLPMRLADNEQKTVNAAWDHTFAPVNRFDKQTLLDALLLGQSFQLGVDRLDFRSEKACAEGLVVMEAHYNRLASNDDRFTLALQDADGRSLRSESYSRAEIEAEYQTVFQQDHELSEKKTGDITPYEDWVLCQINSRVQAAEAVYVEAAATTQPSARSDESRFEAMTGHAPPKGQ